MEILTKHNASPLLISVFDTVFCFLFERVWCSSGWPWIHVAEKDCELISCISQVLGLQVHTIIPGSTWRSWKNFLKLFLYVCGQNAHPSPHVATRGLPGSWLCPSTVWALGLNPRHQPWQQAPFTLWIISLAPNMEIFQKKIINKNHAGAGERAVKSLYCSNRGPRWAALTTTCNFSTRRFNALFWPPRTHKIKTNEFLKNIC